MSPGQKGGWGRRAEHLPFLGSRSSLLRSPKFPVGQDPTAGALMQASKIMAPQTELLLATLALLQATNMASGNPHQPQKVTWAVISTGDGKILNSTTREAVPGAWWPKLYFDLCDLARGSWDIRDWTLTHEGRPECKGVNGCTLPQVSNPQSPGCSHVLKRAVLRDTSFYVCPGSHRTAKEVAQCGGANDYYCAQWGCEQTGTGYWIKQRGNIKVRRVPQTRLASNPLYGHCSKYRCNPIQMTITEMGKRAVDWDVGGTWGLRLYQQGHDQGLLFSIRRIVQPIQELPVIGPIQPILPLVPSPRKT